MLWVLKRTVSMRRFFWAPKTNDENEWYENIHYFMLHFFYLDLCYLPCTKYKENHIRPSLKKFFVCVTWPTISKSHLPQRTYGSFREIFFFLLILDSFSLFLMSFYVSLKKKTPYLPTWKIMSRVTANNFFFKNGLSVQCSVIILHSRVRTGLKST